MISRLRTGPVILNFMFFCFRFLLRDQKCAALRGILLLMFSSISAPFSSSFFNQKSSKKPLFFGAEKQPKKTSLFDLKMTSKSDQNLVQIWTKNHQNFIKNPLGPFGRPRALKGSLLSSRVPFGSPLAAPGPPLGALWPPPGPLWEPFGHPRALKSSTFELRGSIWEPFGRPRALFGSPLAAPGPSLGALWPPLSPQKLDFCTPGVHLGALWPPPSPQKLDF